MKLQKKDLEDIANGAAIYGSGGGGSIGIMQPLIEAVEQAGGVDLVDLKDVGNEEWLAIAAGAGSAATTSTEEAIRRMLKASSSAFVDLRDVVKKDFVYAAAIETGIGNTLIPMVIAAREGIPVIDGAGARRALPDLSMTTFASNAVPICPVVLANEGDYAVTYEVCPTDSDGGASAAGSVMGAVLGTSQFSNAGGIAFYAMNGEILKKAVTARTVHDTLMLGRTLREAKEQGSDPVEAVREALGGFILLERGLLTQHESRISGALDFDNVVFKEVDSSSCFRIYAANESLMAWSDRYPHPVAMGPDLICYLTREGEVFTNADLSDVKGKEIAIIGAPAQPSLRVESVVGAFLGIFRGMCYGGPYVPIEELQVACATSLR